MADSKVNTGRSKTTPDRSKTTPDIILLQVAKRHGLRIADVFLASRDSALVAARYELMGRLYSELGYGYSKIGQLFGMSHSNVIHGVKAWAEGRATPVGFTTAGRLTERKGKV